MWTIILALLAAFAEVAYSECKIFKSTSKIMFKNPDSLGWSFERNETFLGIPIGEQVQQVSAGYTCTNPKSFNKNTPSRKWGFSSGTWCTGLFDPTHRSACIEFVKGNVHVRAMTNLSLETPEDHMANKRIMELVVNQTSFPLFDHGKKEHLKFETGIRNVASRSAACFRQGHSGYQVFAPFLGCMTGTLEKCGQGSKLEQDGQQLAICLPYRSIPTADSPGEEIVGVYYTQHTSKAQAKKHGSNPALKVPSPANSGNFKNAPLSYMSFSVLMISALLLY